MRLLDQLRYLWRDVARRSVVERELEDELNAYVELAVADRVRCGEPSDEARRHVLITMHGMDHVKEAVRDTRRTRWLETLARDARYGLRSLRRNPGFALVAILTLATGVGGATAGFSVVNATLLQPIGGISQPARLVAIERTNGFSYPAFLDLALRTRALSGIGAYVGAPVVRHVSGATSQRLRANLVSASYFGVLGVSPVLGRLLGPADDLPDRAYVAVISYGLWHEAFGGRRDAVGSTIRLNGASFTIVGVASPAFTGTRLGFATDLWTPLAAQSVLLARMSAGIMQSRSAGWLELIGRLRLGQDFATAAAEVRTISAQIAAEYPQTDGDRVASLYRGVGLDPDQRAGLTHLLGVVSAGVALLLLIACANVAGLLVVRASARRHEMAARLALGASRARLVRQLVVEGALLAAAGGIAALTFAVGLARAATRLVPAGSVLRGVPITLDWRVLGVAAAIGLASAVLFTIAPAFQLSRVHPIGAIRAASPGAGGPRQRAQRIVVSAQVALSFALLVAALTLAGAVHRLLVRPPGFDADSLVVASVDLTASGYPPGRGLEFYRRLTERLRATPALRSFAFAKTVPPLDWSDGVSVFQPGTEPPQSVLRDREMELGFRVQLDHVTPAYFRTLGIPVRSGREFTDDDREGAPGVAIVNESFARAFWPEGNAVGQRISWPSLNGPPRPPLLVVGIVADHRYTALTAPPAPLLFVPEAQAYDGRATIVARDAGNPRATLHAVVAAVADVDPDVVVYGAGTMQQRMADSVGQQRTLAFWMLAFAALALVMSAIGIYGVVAQSVGQRTRELSVRMALGATPRRLVGAVIGGTGVLAAVGIAMGVPLAVALGGALREPLAGMSTHVVEAWILSGLLLGATVLAASILPARRAARMDPAEVLRCE